MKRLLVRSLYLSILLYLCIFTSPIFAEENNNDVFSVSNETTYHVNEFGKTNVVQVLVFKNNTEEYYVPDYKLSLASGNIENVWAKNGKGESINFTLDQQENGVVVDFDFETQIVDPNDSFSWELGYDTKGITKKNGLIYEVTIPQIASLNKFDDYNINLEVSRSLGQKNYVSPLPATEIEDENNYIFSFGKIELARNSIVAAFGPYQLFDFSLKYQLENTNDYEVYTEIALPSDKSNQQVFIELIEPAPENTRFDEDENLLAYYTLDPQEKLDIQVSGFARTWLISYNLKESEDIYDIPDDVKIYTKPLPYWESNSKEIKEIAKTLIKDKHSVAEKAQAIFDYVITNLTYNDDRLSNNPSRFGAKGALQNKDQAVCMEYTDLYIALARAADIPAREIDGYAYNADKDIGYVDALHAWVEIFVPPFGWMQIDPTWSSTASSLDYFTKLDTNHLAFVTKGISSEKPYPPGSYTTQDKTGNILVSFSETEREIKPDFDIEFSGVKNFWGQYAEDKKLSGIFARTVDVTIHNNSPFTLYRIDTYLDSENLEVLMREKDIDRFNISPYGYKKISIRVKNSKLLSFGTGSLIIGLEGRDLQSQSYSFEETETFEFTPIFWEFYPIIFGIFGGIIVVGIIFFFISHTDKRK